MFEKFFKQEIEEIRQNKVRVIGLVLCFVFAIVFLIWNYFDTGEEIILTEKPSDEEKNISVQKVPEQNITAVIGANSDVLFVKNPFHSKKEILEEEKEVEKSELTEKISEPVEDIKISTPVDEKFVLSGTAITSEEKTALVQHTKNSVSENLFLSVGDTVGNKKIIDIEEDFILLEDGEKLYLNLQ